ncbi:hypothetical protein GUJ93_ZPchr0008g11684 [Zizania palustris]|uniref:PLATZ transcription factor family protein n=1 Tax=Zizania palustris TaxID=103762 RepID=A0A8J5RFF2_ZIZPA|nr:hypothetical protein GUJ93_ZPchr0008g11684 [Zizania palustris]
MKGESMPPWLDELLSAQFFDGCSSHLLSPRNECNLFCIDCHPPQPQAAFCYYCRSHHHSSHRVIQIRRSSYHNVVRVSELEDILDISGIQTYVINSARVVFLNERPQPRGCGVSAIKSSSSPSHSCETCNRVLLDAFRFCSLGCNFAGIKKDDEMTIAKNVIVCNGRDVEVDNSNGTTKTSEDKICDDSKNNNEVPSSTTVIRRHRRKGIPRRAPFF